jgi:hypothetical protein
MKDISWFTMLNPDSCAVSASVSPTKFRSATGRLAEYPPDLEGSPAREPAAFLDRALRSAASAVTLFGRAVPDRRGRWAQCARNGPLNSDFAEGVMRPRFVQTTVLFKQQFCSNNLRRRRGNEKQENTKQEKSVATEIVN